jgi:hypothetical protein
LVRPVLRPAATPGRPSDGNIEADFKARSVLAADVLHESGRRPGRKRSLFSRAKADETILRDVEAQARPLGLSTHKGIIDEWRRTIKKAPADKNIKISYCILKAFVDGFRTEGSARESNFIVAVLLML